jgi:hypothetical protein
MACGPQYLHCWPLFSARMPGLGAAPPWNSCAGSRALIACAMCAKILPSIASSRNISIAPVSQRQAIRDGMQVFDEFHSPLSLAGRLYGHGYLALLRPIVRRFYHCAPAAIRTRFTRLFSI